MTRPHDESELRPTYDDDDDDPPVSESELDRDASPLLGQLTSEARADLLPRAVRWDEVDAALLAKIDAGPAGGDREPVSAGRSPRRPSRTVVWLPVAGALAVAAAALIFIGRGDGVAPTAPKEAARVAATFQGTDGEGAVLLAGETASTGARLSLGDGVETPAGVRALFQRPAPLSPVTFAVEGGSRATVTRADAPLIFALERGAIEAQVGPVTSGEAFAVDVVGPSGPTRVAVHGTHLRVARVGDRAVVDLTEGVIAIGAPPRAGVTEGAVVTAPAHVEFVPGDTRSLRVDHDGARVRPAAALAVTPSRPAAAVLAHGPELLPVASTTVTARAPTILPAAPAVVSARPVATAVATPTPAADPKADDRIAAAVKACLAARPVSPDVKRMNVTTTITLSLRDDGSVHLARFVPPMPAEVQVCATSAIYNARFSSERAPTVTISVDYER